MKSKILSKLSLKYQIALIVALSQVVIFAVVLAVMTSAADDSYIEQNDAMETVAIATLKKLGRRAILTQKMAEFKDVSNEFTRHPHIRQIWLLNHAQQIIASSGDLTENDYGNTSGSHASPNLEKLEANGTIIPLHTETQKKTKNLENSSGSLAIQFSDDSFAESTTNLLYLAILVAISSILLIASVGFAIGHYLIERIKVLQSATSRIASGDIIAKINLYGNDELSSLGHSFNDMAERITVNINNLYCNQQALLRSQNSLEQSIIDRTEQLAIARDQALDANRIKSKFLANMSHELRTPLNAIIGYSELLSETVGTSGDPEYVDDLHKIKRSGAHLLGLINQILDLSRVEAGKAEIFVEKIFIKQLAYEAMINVKPIMDKNKNSIQLNLPDDIEYLYSDKIKLVQILINLLQNAAKFTYEGTILFSASSYQKNNSSWLSFTIQDNGIGIAKKNMKKLFTEFSQGDESTTREYGGSGLGLAICKSFSNLMGGDVNVESELGIGSIFTLSLPRKITSACTHANAESPLIALKKTA